MIKYLAPLLLIPVLAWGAPAGNTGGPAAPGGGGGGGGSGTVTSLANPVIFGVTCSVASATTVPAITCVAGTPDLGTPSAIVLTHGSGLPAASGLTGDLPLTNFNGGADASGTTFWAGDGTWKTPASLLTVQDAYGNSVPAVTTLTAGAGQVVSGSGGSATFTPTLADVTKSANYTALPGDMGQALNLGGSGGALTLNRSGSCASATCFAAGMSLTINVSASGNWTLTNSTGLTLVGLNSTTLVPGTSGTLVANSDGTHLDFFPGTQPPASGVLGGVASSTLATHNFATGISTAGALTGAQPSAADLSNGVSGGGAVVLASGTVANATNVATTASSINANYFLTFAPSASSGNQAISTDALLAINPSNHYVGIGTNAPAALLDIRGVDSNELSLTSSNVTGTGFSLINSTSGAHTYQFFATGSGGSPGNFILFDATSNRTTFAIFGGTVGGGGASTQAVKLSSTATLGWTSTSSNAVGAIDSGFSRDSANVVDLGTGAGDASGTLQLAALNASGTIKQGTVLSCATGLTTNGSGAITGCVASDPKLKKNMRVLPFDAGLIDRLRPILYDWRDTATYDDKTHAGFNAEELKTAFPEAVKSAGKDLLGVDNSALTGAMVLDLQNSHRIMKTQADQLAFLTARVDRLECRSQWWRLFGLGCGN